MPQHAPQLKKATLISTELAADLASTEQQRGITLPHDLRHPFWDGIRLFRPEPLKTNTQTPVKTEITAIDGEAITIETNRNRP